jgi:hypothetical protein
MRLHTDADNYFDNGEYVLADSGFTCTRNIITMYSRSRGEPDLQGRPVSFSLTVRHWRISTPKLLHRMSRSSTPLASSKLAGQASATYA